MTSLSLVSASSSGLTPWGRSGQSVIPPALKAAKKGCEESFKVFEAALRKHDPQMSIRFQQMCRNKAPGLGDLVSTVDDIVKAANKRHPTNNRTFATRFIKLLERVKDFATIGDVLVGGAQNMVVSGVWGTVRLAIEISLSSLTFYEKVSDMLYRVGKFSELNADFETLFPESRQLQALACEYLAIVVDISTRIVSYAQKTRMEQFLYPFASTFEQDFKDLESKLGTIAWSIKQRADIESEYLNRAAHSITHDLAGKTMALIKDSQKEKRHAAKKKMLRNLSANQDHVRPTWQRHYARGLSTWLLDQDGYKQWKSSEASCCLSLVGNLGSGKSVTAASVIADLSNVGDARKSQVIQPHIDNFLKATRRSGTWDSPSDAFTDLLIQITPSTWSGFFIVDGIDQCGAEEVETLVSDLCRLSANRRILLFLSSRTYWKPYNDIMATLRSSMAVTTCSMEGADRESEAARYIDIEMRAWKDDLASPREKEMIRQSLLDNWNRMFLWLALQLHMIRDELHAGVKCGYVLARLPHDLSDLYNRVLAPVAARKDQSTRVILELVVAADPPLSFKELRAAANVQPFVLKWSSTDTTPIPSAFCRRYGGYLLEVDQIDDKVRFIHPSVALHLCKAGDGQDESLYVDLDRAQERLGHACLTLLNLDDSYSNTALQRRSADTRATQPIAWAADSIVDDSRVGRLLDVAYKGVRNRSRSSINAPTLIFDVLTRPEGQCIPTDFLRYAKTHWVSATNSLKLTETQQELWNKVAKGKAPNGSLPKYLMDYGAGIVWALEKAHLPLFMYHSSDSSPLRREIDDEWLHRLRDLLMSDWAGTDLPGPWLMPFLEWLVQQASGSVVRHCELFVRLACGGLLETDQLRFLALRLAGSICSYSAQSADFKAAVRLLQPFTGLEDCINAKGLQKSLLSIVLEEGVDVSERVAILLDLGANPDGQGKPEWDIPIYLAIEQNEVGSIRAILAYGGDIDRRDSRELTPLMIAVQAGNLQIVELLLDHSAALNAQDCDGRTPIHVAAESAAVDVLKVLISKLESDPNKLHILDLPESHSYGGTALYNTLDKGNVDCANLLLKAGARRILDWDQGVYRVSCGAQDNLFDHQIRSLVDNCPTKRDFENLAKRSAARINAQLKLLVGEGLIEFSRAGENHKSPGQKSQETRS